MKLSPHKYTISTYDKELFMKPYRFLSPLLIVNLICSMFFLCLPLTLFAGQFPIPDTGQTTCYDDVGHVLDPCPSPGEPFYGQDANYSINPRSYTKLDENGNDLPVTATSWTMVRDNVTGLIWEVKTDDHSIHDKDNKYHWSGAQTVFIAELNAHNFGGYTDWRLPSIQELYSILYWGSTESHIDTEYFPNTVFFTFDLGWFWSFTDGAYNNVSKAGYARNPIL